MSRDAQKTLSVLRALPTEKQSVVAAALIRNISSALAELESNPDPRHQFEVWIEIAQRARLQRHVALMRGAQSAQDSDWAVAALVESWAFLMSAGISAGHKAGLALQRSMLEWAAPLVPIQAEARPT